MAVTRDQVLQTALAILDQYGLADLSMRRVATALGVQPGALYWHVANKQTLLIGLADLIIAELAPPRADQEQPLVEWGMRLQQALLAHRHGAELLSAASSLRPAGESVATRAADSLSDGAPDPALVRQCTTVLHLVIGATLDLEQRISAAELGLGEHPDVRQAGRALHEGLVAVGSR